MANFVSQRAFTIEWGLCDPAGIVFNSRYFELFDEGTWVLFETVLAVPRTKLFATFNIMGIPLVDARARFLVPVKFGDAVVMTSEVAEFRRSSFDAQHRLLKAGQLAVDCLETRVWTFRDADGRMKGVPIPEEIRAKFVQRNL